MRCSLTGVSGPQRSLRVLGVIIIVGGLVTPLIGVERAHIFLAWWATQGTMGMRLWASIALVFGLFLAYAARTPPARTAREAQVRR